MLVTRPFDTGRNTWSNRKFEDVFTNASSPRMSNFEGLATQPDWREQYTAFPLPGDNVSQSSYDSASHTEEAQNTQTQHQSATRPPLGGHRHTTGTSLQEHQPLPAIERPDSAPGDCGTQNNEEASEESLLSSEATRSSGLGSVDSTSSISTHQSMLANNEGGDLLVEVKDEDDDDELDDDEMLDAEDGGAPQTAAERRAERRKMKRFRLTHQQTRFLMSEFAKQAHPDAAHRERLSKEIPGLSPRQVQVWFQNRRAKIKRLTADDRERMMKMRAVPDDFDNVQALHSPYGAVHGIGTPLQSPVDFMPTYAEHMMRPLMIDTMRRQEGDEQHMSPTGLSPAFGHIGFNAGAGVGTPDGLSPLSINSNDRFYGSQMSSPMSAGPRSAHFDRQSAYQGIANNRQHVRPLQPLQLRETMSRNRSESLQSPLRSSMSWKGETLDYANYQPGHPSPQLSGRQQSLYQPENASNSSVNSSQYEGNTYPTTTVHSPPHLGFATAHGSSQSLQQSAPATMSRLRASSGSGFPPGLDLRNQYRTIPSQTSANHLTTPRSGSFSNAFSGGYPSAPLTAPVDFTLPRTTEAGRDFNMPQMSAPMAPSSEFANAFRSSINANNRGQQQSEQHEFSGQTQQTGEQGQQQQQDNQGQMTHQNSRSNDDSSFLRPPEYEPAQTRKRSFTMPGQFETA